MKAINSKTCSTYWNYKQEMMRNDEREMLLLTLIDIHSESPVCSKRVPIGKDSK
jgi:hypothetical protein